MRPAGQDEGTAALSMGLVDATSDDLLRITVAALGVDLLMLLLFQGLLQHDGMTPDVASTAAVLLVSLGSDHPPPVPAAARDPAPQEERPGRAR